MPYCLISLVEILEKILHPEQHHQTWVLDHDKIPQIQSLLEVTSFLRDLLANSASQARIESLVDRIGDLAENTETVLESHITSQILSNPGVHSFMISPSDLQDVTEMFESAKEEMLKIKDVSRPDYESSQPLEIELTVVSSRSDPNPKNMVVGVTEDLKQLKNRLTGQSSKLEIIPIVGMGGTGKTTLARILFDEFSSSKSHFDVCAWVTISQDYNPRGVLQTLLDCVIGNPTNVQDTNQLIVSLYKSLFSRRYFIVLDDIWSSDAWNAVQRAFPHDNQGSRIILTTRENNMADYVDSTSHEMHLLNENDSWELLRKRVFGEDSCPHELEEVGKRIANSCRGLPLAVQVTGGLLSQADRSKDFWEQVASDVSSCIANENEHFSGIFSWSYVNLPHYLKPCFLYMGAFPEDYKIRASKLIELWVAEGFLYPIRNKTLEEAAGTYLNSLVERNLIFVRERNRSGKVKSYGIHDLLRDLCMRKAEEKKFLCVKNSKVNNLPGDTSSTRRVCVHSLHAKGKLTSVARSFLSMTVGVGPAGHDKILSSLCFDLSLLRVLDVLEIVFPIFPVEILQLVNLRYLALLCKSEFPEDMSTLRNLQILIIAESAMGLFTLGMFDLPQLRHVQFSGLQFLEGFTINRNFPVQENLHSLSTIPVGMLTQLFPGKIPNLRKLEVNFLSYTTTIFELTCFQKLETLKCSGNYQLSRRPPKLPSLVFPDSLRKLTLWWCTVPETFMSTISIMLPNLEILKLERITLENTTWEPCEGEFCSLHYLQLNDMNLVNWLVDETHFPVLEHLVIQRCHSLNEIPLEIGGIETLVIIEVDEGSNMVLESATRIIDEQRYFGNDLLQLLVTR